MLLPKNCYQNKTRSLYCERFHLLDICQNNLLKKSLLTSVNFNESFFHSVVA